MGYEGFNCTNNHDSDGPQNLVTSKGSLPLPVRLSTRLLVARKS